MDKEKERAAWTVIIDHDVIPKIKILAAKNKQNIGEYLEEIIDGKYKEFLDG